MQTRINPFAAAPEGYKTVAALETYIHDSGLEEPLIHLVKMRASQINGCAFCLDMHSRDARAKGETEQRLAVLPAWRETTLYTPREQAALAWTEALTLIVDTHAPDDVYEAALAQFGDKGLADLTILIGTINLWNRLAIGFRAQFPARKNT